MKITFVGNHEVDYSSETHYVKTLESMGHKVTKLQEGRATAQEIFQSAANSDMLVFVHTHGWHTEDIDKVLMNLKTLNVPTVTYHLDLWLGLDRQKDLEDDPFYKHIQYFFTVDKLMADYFNQKTNVRGFYLEAGVFDQEAVMLEPIGNQRDVVFVGSKGYHPEWPYRPQLIDNLRKWYGQNFTHVGGDGEIKTTRGRELNQLYANSKIVVGDSLNIGFNYPYYSSDRFFETMGRGGFLIYPKIEGFAEDFKDKEHVAYYKHGDWDDLKKKIDYYLEHDDEREAIRRAGHELVKSKHTYKHRWRKIIKIVDSVEY